MDHDLCKQQNIYAHHEVMNAVCLRTIIDTMVSYNGWEENLREAEADGVIKDMEQDGDQGALDLFAGLDERVHLKINLPKAKGKQEMFWVGQNHGQCCMTLWQKVFSRSWLGRKVAMENQSQ